MAFVFWFLLHSTVGTAQEPELTRFVRLADNGQLEKAVKGLLAVDDKKFAADRLNLKYLALGEWSLRQKNYPGARVHLEHAMQLNPLAPGHILYLIGHSYKEEGLASFDDARKTFQKVLNLHPTQNIALQTRLELAEMAIVLGQYGTARDHLMYLERRWRGTPSYANIVWQLIGVELKSDRRHVACRWARKMYAKYPSYPPIKDWGVDLSLDKYAGRALGCLASDGDTSTRLSRLQLNGLADKARQEIDELRSHATPHEVYGVDRLLISYLESQGFPDEALRILIPYYEVKHDDFGYQMQFAKVASRAGEYQAAIGAYYTAYRLNSRSRKGKNALFMAAILSYQIQDYDGAFRRFTDIAKKFAGSGLARDARWNIAWLQYLRGQYPLAEKNFRVLLAEKVVSGRRRRVSRPFANDRTKYWYAMSLLRQEKLPEARENFARLSEDRAFGFYSLLASKRLLQIPKVTQERKLSSTEQPDADNPAVEVVASEAPRLLFSTNGELEKSSDDAESDEALQAAKDSQQAAVESPEDGEGEGADTVTEDQVADEGDAPAAEETVSVTAFRDPHLRDRFTRAQQFASLGLNEWAMWEFFEIERRTRNKAYLKMLMDAYSRSGSFNRVAYIAEIYFGRERQELGLTDGSDLWRLDYPRAFGEKVETYAKKFGIPEATVLSIMRAESQFNPQAISPVGARGLMQIMPYTADQLSKLLGENSATADQLLDPDVNIRLGAKYLSRLQRMFQDQIPLVAAAYNAGPHRVYGWLANFGTLDMDEFIEHVPYVETRNYIKKVVRNYALYTNIYSGSSDSLHGLISPVPVKVAERPSPRESWEKVD